jgi:malate dehydrogenase
VEISTDLHVSSADVVVTVDLAIACRDVEVAVMVGGFSPRQGMTRQEAFREIGNLYAAQGAALEQYASRHVRVGCYSIPLDR